MSKPSTFDPDYAVPPGATLLETIDSLGLTQKELAQRMGRPVKTINEIVKGTVAITAETALQLEKVTGVPASFWNNMEANYRERLARLKERNQIEAQLDWLKCFSYSKMVELGLVKETRDRWDRVNNLLNFFGVASATQWETTYGSLQGAAREAAKWESQLGDLSVWLRAGELKARNCRCESYETNRFKGALKEIRGLTRQCPSKVWPEVCAMCADAGVAVVLVPELPKTHVNGFTRWLTSDKALIQLSLRHKTDDVLWFTFFHEAAHILLHGKKDVFLETRGVDNEKEAEANNWAANFLIQRRFWHSFLESPRFDRSGIDEFAESMGIASSIVLGRLQKERYVPYKSPLQSLKRRLDIVWSGIDEEN